jgi:hypothetical protein
MISEEMFATFSIDKADDFIEWAFTNQTILVRCSETGVVDQEW